MEPGTMTGLRMLAGWDASSRFAGRGKGQLFLRYSKVAKKSFDQLGVWIVSALQVWV